MRKTLKLFVWEDVYCDYTCGIAFALARNADHARKLILKKRKDDGLHPDGDLNSEPIVLNKPAGFYVCGGG